MTRKNGDRAFGLGFAGGLSLLGLVSVAAAIAGAAGVQPARAVTDGFFATVRLAGDLTRTRPEGLYPIRHQGTGVVAHDPAAATPGLILVQGLLPGGPQVRLIDTAGNELHRWDVDFFAAWDDPGHILPAENVPKSRLHYHTQGFAAQPDGSILVNLSEKGSVMMDRCGRVLWTVDRMTHHSVTPTPDGGYLLPAHIPVESMDQRFIPPGMTREGLSRAVAGWYSYPENTVLKVDANGRPEEEFSVLAAVHDAGLEAAIHDGGKNDRLDPTHLNDIDLVTDALARRIPAARPGDFLVSLRNMNMLAILDQDDGSLKWHRRGPWVRQHDPDITPDGMIEIFNNRSPETAPGEYYSQLLRYDPASDEVTVLHPAGAEDLFASEIQGTHQVLPSGNRLITESTAGRILEVTPAGKLVWSYVLRYDDEYAALIESAEWVPADFFNVRNWTCPLKPDPVLAENR